MCLAVGVTFEPIGIVRTEYRDRYRAPRQPGAWGAGDEAKIELFPRQNYEQALRDLAGMERIWVITWFDRNRGWKPMVMPPRGPEVRRGVFATRSPHRPNPIGLSLVQLLSVRGRVLRVAGADLLDGTPVLDLKPYLPRVEAYPDAPAGWISELESEEGSAKKFEVLWSDLAALQAAWLADEHGIELRDVVERVLSSAPLPGRDYRRIEPHPEAGFALAVKSWRVLYGLNGTRVQIARVASGYTASTVAQAAVGTLEDDRAHREFHARWA